MNYVNRKKLITKETINDFEQHVLNRTDIPHIFGERRIKPHRREGACNHSEELGKAKGGCAFDILRVVRVKIGGKSGVTCKDEKETQKEGCGEVKKKLLIHSDFADIKREVYHPARNLQASERQEVIKIVKVNYILTFQDRFNIFIGVRRSE